MDIDRRRLIAGAGGALAFAAFPAAAKIALSPPASAGVTPAGLAALNREMHAMVDRQQLAGVVTLLARKGKVVNLDAYGRRDASKPDPVATDTIFRIASMTKPVVGVALMQFYEQGRWKLDDPVAKHIPEFAGLKVAVKGGAPVDQVKPMTMAQIMSHTAGLGGGNYYEGVNLYETDLRGAVEKLARTPLYAQPGTDWVYGPSVDVQGYLVEKFSGMDLADYLQAHVFNPLKMPDTQFWVAPEKVGRVSALHTYADGKIVAADLSTAPGVPGFFRTIATSKPRLQLASGGLYSTAPDYYRFCQALLNGGALDGARILKPETVKLMRKSVLEPGVVVDLFAPQPGIGFGLDFAIQEDPAASGLPQGVGSYWWGGAFGTWMWIDPANDLIFIGLIQNINGSVPGRGTPDVRKITPALVYDALVDRKA